MKSLIPILAAATVLNCPAGAAAFSFGLSAAGDTIAAPLESWVDSVKAGGPGSLSDKQELKDMLARETGEPVLEGTGWERKKNPRMAMLCALVFPGLGQIYNEKPFKAALAMGFEVFYLSRVLHYYRMAERQEKIRDSYPRWITTEGENPVTYQNYNWTEADAWLEEYKQRQIDWIWWSGACVLVVIFDAYVDAHIHDMKFKVEGSPAGDTALLSLVVDF